MKKTLALLNCLFAFVLMAGAQAGVAGKISKANNKISNADTAVQGTTAAINSAAGTLGNAGKALNNLGSVLGISLKKKPKPGDTETAGTPGAAQTKQPGNANTITISVAGADYPSLKKLRESFKALAGVQSVDMNYNSSGSSLSIAFSKKADDLWDGLSDDMATHYNVISMNDNAINIAYRQ